MSPRGLVPSWAWKPWAASFFSCAMSAPPCYTTSTLKHNHATYLTLTYPSHQLVEEAGKHFGESYGHSTDNCMHQDKLGSLRFSSQLPVMANVFAVREAWTLGLVKCRTWPSSLIMLTSSIPWMLLTPSFFRDCYISHHITLYSLHCPISKINTYLKLFVICRTFVNYLLLSSSTTLRK